MKVYRPVCLGVFLAALSLSCPAAELSTRQQETISNLFEILTVIYDYDVASIPDEPNEIMALETSAESRDLLAWELFKLIRCELDPAFCPMEEAPPTAELSPEMEEASSMEAEPAESQALSQVMAMESEPILDLAGPLDSCILESRTYRITQLPLQIMGHVVIPAGTRLIAPFDPNSNIIEVMPGGLLDMGRAAFYSAEEYPQVLPAVEIVPEDPNEFFIHNYIGIYVRRGADPRTRIENAIVENCTIGILINEALEYPVRQVITVACFDGIHLYAPAAISNSEFWYNGCREDGFLDYNGAGIYVCQDVLAYPGATAAIRQTVTYYGDAGVIFDRWIYDPNLTGPLPTDPNIMTPKLSIINSCLAYNAYFGLYQFEEGVAWDVSYSAFCENSWPVNFEADMTGCFTLDYTPLYNRDEDWKRLYVIGGSHLTDAGCGMASDGTGTDPDWPDTGIMDIGCHFPLGASGGFGIPSSPADFNWDGTVDELDLELMNACMGATDDPNLLRMDFDRDSWINLPDWGVYAGDYGWAADPNFSWIDDPNGARSDFNADGWVNLEDLAILAEHWLVPVLDEYRLCGLCNLHTGIDPNDPNVPAGFHTIDQRDMSVFMEDWGMEVLTDFSASFYNNNDQTVEPNQLSGLVALQADEYPPTSLSLFLQVDGVPAGETWPYGSAPPVFEIPTYEYSNGNHVLTIGGYLQEGGCWIEEIPVRFENRIYLASIPEMYVPNEAYVVTGFFDGGTVTISTDPNSSMVFDGWYIEYAAMIDNPEEAELAIHIEEGVYSESQSFALLASVDLSKMDPNSYRAVIIAPNRRINLAVEDPLLANNRLLSTIRQTLQEANIPYQELIGKNANWDNIRTALTAPNMNYVYWIGHMSTHVGRVVDDETGAVVVPGVQRTGFMCWDERPFLWDRKNCVFSWLESDNDHTPEPVLPLPGNWDTRGHSMASLELWERKTIKEFWAIGCNSSEFNDMALAVGVYNYTDTAGHYTHIYIGNRIDVMPGGVRNLLKGYPSALSKIIRRHRTTHLGNALLTNDLTQSELEVLWGPDRNRDGYSDNTLQWWPEAIELFRVIFQ